MRPWLCVGGCDRQTACRHSPYLSQNRQGPYREPAQPRGPSGSCGTAGGGRRRCQREKSLTGPAQGWAQVESSPRYLAASPGLGHRHTCSELCFWSLTAPLLGAGELGRTCKNAEPITPTEDANYRSSSRGGEGGKPAGPPGCRLYTGLGRGAKHGPRKRRPRSTGLGKA